MAESDRQRRPRKQRSRIHKAFDGLLAVAVVPLVLLSLFPATTPARWLSTRALIAQGLAFPVALGVAIAISALILGALRCYAATLIALVSALGLISTPAPPLIAQSAQPGQAQLTVTTFNTLNSFNADALHELLATNDPDVIVLPEASPKLVRAAVAGTPFEGNVIFSSDVPDWMATTVITHSRLGTIQQIPGVKTTLGAVTVRPSKLDVTIVAVHTNPPVRGGMEKWRADLDRMSKLAQGQQEFTIIAGDLNANLRHGGMTQLGAFQDTARLCSRYPAGTWPTDGIYGLRTQIDHVLVNRPVHVESCQTQRVGDSDHLAYTTRFSYQP